MFLFCCKCFHCSTGYNSFQTIELQHSGCTLTIVIKGSDYRSTTEIYSSLPNNSLYFFYCDGGRGISTELGLTDVNNGVCGFIYKNVGWRGCGILVPMTDVVTDYNMFVGRLSGENKLKWVGVK